MRRKITWMCLVVMVIAALMLVGCAKPEPTPTPTPSPTPTQKQKVELKYTTWQPPTHTLTVTAQKAFDELDKKTNGRIKITIHHSASLMTEREVVEGVSVGIADAGLLYGPLFASTIPLLSATQLPLVFADAEHASRTLTDPSYFNVVSKFLSPYGVTAVGIAWVGSYMPVSVDKQIKVPSDLKGLKVRAGGKIPTDLAKVLGGAPVSMSSTEVYEAFMRGLLDVCLMNPSGQFNYKWWEVAKYVEWFELYSGDATLIMSNKTMQSLSSEDLKLVEETLKTAGKYMSDAFALKQLPGGEFYKNTFEKYTVHEPSAAEIKLWYDATRPITDAYYDTLSSKDKGIFDEMMALIKKHK